MMKLITIISALSLCSANLSELGGSQSWASLKKPASKLPTNLERVHHSTVAIGRGGGQRSANVDLAIAGALATMIGDFAMHPVDCIKTLQQSNAGSGLSMLAASKEIFKTGGIGGFYSGLATYVFCDGAAGAIKFATYEKLKKWANENVKEENIPIALFGCAAAAFIASSFLLVPGELIKQRLQTGQYSSMMDGVRSIMKNDGLPGFYCGYAAVCFRDVPYTMLELGLYDNLKSAYCWWKNRGEKKGRRYEISQQDEILIGAITGGIVGYVTNPLDSIKTKIVTSDGAYSGFIDCFRKTVSENGFASLFNGGGARVSWLMPFTAIYLPVYENLKRSLEGFRNKQTNLSTIRGGSMAPNGRTLAFNSYVCRKSKYNDIGDNRTFV